MTFAANPNIRIHGALVYVGLSLSICKALCSETIPALTFKYL